MSPREHRRRHRDPRVVREQRAALLEQIAGVLYDDDEVLDDDVLMMLMCMC